MPFARPSLTQLDDRKKTDIETRLPGTDARLRRSIVQALAKSSTAVCHGIYGYLDFISRQIHPVTAEEEYLDRSIELWLGARVPAAAATGNVDATGTNGVTIPAGTTLVRSDSVEYTVDADATIASGTASVAITASVAGQGGNYDSGGSLTISPAITGINSVTVVDASGLTGGADIESDDAAIVRIKERIQTPPHGGALADYVTWAKEVSGVTRAVAVENLNGPGTVGLYFVRDNDADLIPDAAEVQAVQDYIDAATRRPVGMAGFVAVAPTKVTQAMTIAINPNTTAVQDAIQAELEDLFLREAQIEDGAASGTVYLSHIDEAISIATGEFDHNIVSPTADLTLTVGQISVLGTITWQTL